MMFGNTELHQSKIRIALVGLFNRSIFSKKFSAAICSSMVNRKGCRRADYVFDWDIIRSSSLELVSIEIYDKKIVGNVAELGIFRGEFAEKINKAFPDRKLYLFDTFEGFNKKDLEIEALSKYSKHQHDFTKTNEEIVLQKMKFRENCIIRKGYFPETANGIEDKFVFVSIDADLYEPIYNGLRYFYPRLVKGGYIFVHDYNANIYVGARQAVLKYCDEEGITFFFFFYLCCIVFFFFFYLCLVFSLSALFLIICWYQSYQPLYFPVREAQAAAEEIIPVAVQGVVYPAPEVEPVPGFVGIGVEEGVEGEGAP
jgi:O-methyltransferase